MSLDVSLYSPDKTSSPCPRCSPCYECGGSRVVDTTEEAYSANITHNLGAMADAAGIYEALWRPEEIGVSKARELAPLLRVGLKKLKNDPAKFKALNPENGWGNYEGLVKFVEDYLKECEAYPDHEIRVSR